MTSTYNARPGAPAGTVARARYVRMSATKARAVLDLIRGAEVAAAQETLRLCERDAAIVIGKLLRSAVANAEHNDDQIAEDLVVSACYADEGRTIRRFRPRARGRATRIRKRTCHLTIVVSRMSEEQLERRRTRDAARPGTRAARRAGQEAVQEKVQEKAGRSRRRRGRGGGGGAGAAAPADRQRAPGGDAPEQAGPSAPEEAATSSADAPPEAPAPDDGLGLFQDDADAASEGPQPAAAPDDPPQAAEQEEER
jgi:large subunit ribosomal protein L22